VQKCFGGLDRSKHGQQLAPTLEQITWNCMRCMQLVKRRNWPGERRQCIFRMSMIRRGRCSYVVCRSSGSKVCTDQQMHENNTNRRRLLNRAAPCPNPKLANCDAGTISIFFNHTTLQNWCSASIDPLSSAACSFPLPIVFVSGLMRLFKRLVWGPKCLWALVWVSG
jgi:hypothetical protein